MIAEFHLEREEAQAAVESRAFATSCSQSHDAVMSVFDKPCPTGNTRCSTVAWAAPRISASLAALSVGTIGSCAPDKITAKGHRLGDAVPRARILDERR
jgi:hypothetical protein